MRLAALLLIVAAALASGTPRAASAGSMYYPEYAAADGTIVEFNKTGFLLRFFDDEGDAAYDCRKLESLTSSIHWAQCVGGERFLFTLDPKHPETMKIGDVVYRECGKLWDKC